MDKTKKALLRYVNAGADLAESVKRNITKDGVIDNKTVLKLNEFIIASNELSDINNLLTDDENESNIEKH